MWNKTGFICIEVYKEHSTLSDIFCFSFYFIPLYSFLNSVCTIPFYKFVLLELQGFECTASLIKSVIIPCTSTVSVSLLVLCFHVPSFNVDDIRCERFVVICFLY